MKVLRATLDPQIERLLALTRRSTAHRIATGLVVGAVGWTLFQLALPRPTPFGIVLLGVVIGTLNALLALGLVLVYRTNRIVNFAQGEIGVVGAILAVELVFTGWPYFAAAAVGLVTAIVVAGIVETTIVRRFRDAPRLLLTVATIACSQILGFLTLFMPRWFGAQILSPDFRTPLSGFSFEVAPVRFDGNYVLVVAFGVVAVAALAWFLGRTSFGIAVRAAAENAERAALVGIPTKALSTIVWLVAGGLSGAAAILRAPVIGITVGVPIGPGLLLRALAAAVIARMESLPVTIAAGIGLGIFEQAVFWAVGRTTAVDALLLVVILVALVVRRRRSRRADEGQTSSWQAVSAVRPIPTELRRLKEVVWGRVGVIGLVTAVALILPVFARNQRTLLSAMVIYAMVGVSLVALTGWAGQISLGQFAIVALGAAVAGTLAESGRDFFLALGAGVGAGLLAAVVLGLPALRLRGFLLAVTTLAFAVTTSSYFLQLDWLVPEGIISRPRLFGRIDIENELAYYYVCVAALLIVVLAMRSFRSSRIGRAVVAVRDNQRSAQAYGINATVAKLAAFAVSGAIAGLAGGMFVTLQHRLVLNQYDPNQSIQAFTMVVVGGAGSLLGGVLGAVFVRGAQLLPPPFPIFATGLGLVFVLLLLPEGLGSMVFKARDAVLRRLADAKGIVVASILADKRVEPSLEPDEGDDPLGLPLETELVGDRT